MRRSRAQQLTGRATGLGRAEARPDAHLLREGCPRKLSRSAHPGPRNPARETITRTPAATSPPARLTSPAPRPWPLKSPESREKIGGKPQAIPKCEHRQDWVAVGAVSSEPVSPRFPPHPGWRTKSNVGWIPTMSCNLGISLIAPGTLPGLYRDTPGCPRVARLTCFG